MNRYNVITTIDIERMQIDENNVPKMVVIPAGSVINTILWDGTSVWVPPENTKVEPE